MSFLLEVALLQMSSFRTDQEANMRKGEEFCRRARAMGADIALFPEMWNIGYTPYDPKVFEIGYDPTAVDDEERRKRKEWQALAVGEEEEFVLHYRKLAKELEMAIAVSYLQKWPGAPRTAVSIIDRRGGIILTYGKVHTCDFSLEASCTPGDDFFVSPLDTAKGEVKVGAMICFDREHPESARVLMLKGAEIILTPNACDLEENRIGQFRARAYENMVGVAMANYASPECNGHSIAFDGIAFDREGVSRNTLVVEAGEREGVYLAAFDMEALRKYRKRETWGNAFRKPGAYGILTSPEVKEPFLRKSARR